MSDWLTADSELYWVTGKAGSGKSTLIKYVAYDHNGRARCVSYLEKWAPPPLKLIVVTHFFWNSGATVQMSHNGLLRSLLHQILAENLSLVPKVLSARWEALCLFGEGHDRDWSLTELVTMLDCTLSHLRDSSYICFFIDGLDEFEGDHLMLGNLCKQLASNINIKVCVASRPWNVFEQAFDLRPSLRMEDLTRSDITSFVTAELTASPDFANLKLKEPQFSSRLIDQIVDKASGVFL